MSARGGRSLDIRVQYRPEAQRYWTRPNVNLSRGLICPKGCIVASLMNWTSDMRYKMSGGALVMSERMHGLECQTNRHDQRTN